MPMVEIDESELAALQGAYKTLNGMYTKNRLETEKLAKATFGDKIRTSEDDAAPILEPYKNRIEAMEKWKTDLEKSQKNWQENEQITTLRNQGYTEEGVEAIKKLMKDRNLPDPEVAAALFDKLNPPQPSIPNGLQSNNWNFGATNDDDLKELFKDEEAWADREAIKTFQEIRQGKQQF